MKRTTILLLALFSLNTLLAGSKDGETRTCKHVTAVSFADVISLNAKNTYVTIETWDKNEVEVIATVIYNGEPNDKVRKFIDEFDVNVATLIQKSSGVLSISTQLDEPNKVQIGSRIVGIQVGFNEKELRIEYALKVPAKNKLVAKCSYKDLIMTGQYDDVDITQYSADLVAKIFKSAKLNLKYGDTRIDRIGTGAIESYENDTHIGESDMLEINDKYSDISFKTVNELKITGYETKMQVENIDILRGDLKYGSLRISGKVGQSVLTLYEFTISGEAAGNMRMENSKYSKITLDRANEIKFIESYEDKVNVRYLNNLITKSKYGIYTISQLGKRLELYGYEDDVTIEEVTDGAESLMMDGKYLTLALSTKGKPYSLNANVKYGKINYNQSAFDVRKYIKEGDNLTIEAVSKSGSSSFNVTLKGYEVKANIL